LNDNLALVGLVLNFIGALFLVFPRLRSSADILAQAGTYYERNPHLGNALRRDSRFALTGFLVMAVGFFLQILSRIT
jgi:hypothetical protein